MGHLNIPKIFNREAASLINARKKCIDIHGSDLRAAGNEVEIAVRQWLGRILPETVSVGHGHIIDPKSTISPQLDCILRERSKLPTLFTTSDGTEYTPVDSVYAYGEIKSTYAKHARQIQEFITNKKRILEDLDHTLIENTAKDGITNDSLFHHILLGSSQRYLNQIFTFMLFIDSGDATVDELSDLYMSTEDKYLPDITVFLNGCAVLKATAEKDNLQICRYGSSTRSDVDWKIIPAHQIQGTDATSEGKHLGFLYYCLVNHIRDSALEGPNLASYLKDLLITSKSSVVSIPPSKHQGPENSVARHQYGEQKDD